MFETIRNAFKQEDLRKKLIFTFIILLVYRLGNAITVPFLDPSSLSNMFSGGGFFSFLNIMTGGGLQSASIFALGIQPYINSSIIMQLLTIAIPALERLSKEGAEGQKVIQKITRYVTVVLSLIMGTAFYLTLRNTTTAIQYKSGFSGVFSAIVIIGCFMAGSALVVWLGERITEKGIGNGISIILFAGIISRGPSVAASLIAWWQLGKTSAKFYFLVPLVIILFVAIIAFVVWMSEAERRIPVSYAKRVVGRKMYGGQSTHIPIKVNMSGVMPIIFAMSFVQLPSMIATFVNVKEGGFWDGFFTLFQYDNWFYGILTFLLIIAFNYFYVSIQYNPVEIANNLRKNNGAIPGLRPGKPTSDFIKKVISKITLIGAWFLGLIAVFPIAFSAVSGMNISLGGSSMLILVGVALETVRQMESQMMMRHHKGFLD